MTGLSPEMMSHLVVAPVLLPMLTAAVMLLLGEKRRSWKALLNVSSCALGLLLAVVLLMWVDGGELPAAAGLYLPSNWPTPYGIVLVVDRLSALMLVLSSGVALSGLLFSVARWHRAGVHFHPLFQIQLAGLYGAFLTGDLFNLFVFFEVMLVASYGLLLHGSGRARVQSGLHYIAVNLVASSFFLVGVALLYGVTGTLNLADMADKLPGIPAQDRGLLHAGAAILGMAFLIKAAVWPLNFWLVPAYTAASAPVAALFVLMTKVGVYALMRVWTLLFPGSEGLTPMTAFGAEVLTVAGLATLTFGAIGALACQHSGRLAGYCIIMSAGVLLAATGLGQPVLTGGALFYLLSSTLGVSALFLLGELIERSRESPHGVALSETTPDGAPFAMDPLEPFDARVPLGVNLDDLEQALIGQAMPAAMAFLGLAFIICTLVVTGLPPLAGFVAKLALLSALLDPAGLGVASSPPVTAAWALGVLLILSGLACAVALCRIGIRCFWAPVDRAAPALRMVECLPVMALLLACVALTVSAGPVLRYTLATAQALHQPATYIKAVQSARPVLLRPDPQRASP